MKGFNVADLALQSLIIGAVILSAVMSLGDGSIETMATFALFGAFFLGPWQMFSSLLTSTLKQPFLRLRVIHLIISTVYLIAISVVVGFYSDADFGDTGTEVSKVIGFGVPTLLAFFYYYITFRSFRLYSIKQPVKP